MAVPNTIKCTIFYIHTYTHCPTTNPTSATMPSMAESPGMVSLLRQAFEDRSRSKTGTGGGGGRGLLRTFKLLPMLTSGCKMVKLLSSRTSSRAMLTDKAIAVTLFGHRRGRVCLAIQEDPRSPPFFLIELPVPTSVLHREMDSGLVKLALESETRTQRKRLVDEYVWAVYCNGRKSGYAIRRKEASEEERRVMQLLRGVSLGAGVLQGLPERETATEGELTYVRARFERVVGSNDSESYYMINPDGEGGGGGAEITIFLVRLK